MTSLLRVTLACLAFSAAVPPLSRDVAVSRKPSWVALISWRSTPSGPTW